MRSCPKILMRSHQKLSHEIPTDDMTWELSENITWELVKGYHVRPCLDYLITWDLAKWYLIRSYAKLTILRII